jgi:hypothetical protein
MNRFLPSVGMERTTTLELQKNKESMKKNHDALAELEKQFVQWRMLSPRIEEEAAARFGRLAELSKEARQP